MSIKRTKKTYRLAKLAAAFFSIVLLITCGGGGGERINIANPKPPNPNPPNAGMEEYPPFSDIIPNSSSVHLTWENPPLNHTLNEEIYRILIAWNASVPSSSVRNPSVDQVLYLDGDETMYWNDMCPSHNDNNSDNDEDGIGDACDMMNHPSLSVMPGNQRLTLRWKTKYFEQLMGDEIEQYGIVFIDPQGVRGKEINLPAAQRPDDDGYLSYVYIDDGLRNGARYDFIFSYVDDTGASGNWTGSVHIGADTDRDGMADFIDADDDNDGIPDRQEAGWSSMINGYNYTTISAVDGRIVLPRYNATDPTVKALYDNDEVNFSVHGFPSNSSYNFIVKVSVFAAAAGISRQSLYDDMQDGRLNQTVRGHRPDIVVAYAEGIVTGINYDNDEMPDHLDPDDDDDGMNDFSPDGSILDECPFSINPGQFEGDINDINRNGCEDGVDEILPGVRQLTAIGNQTGILLTWISPDESMNGLVEYISILYTKNDNDNSIEERVDLTETQFYFSAESLNNNLDDTYTFNVTLVYKNLVLSASAYASAQINVGDDVDDDGDGDGIKDSEDSCPLSRTAGFVSDVNTNDIDGDGCEDQTEDVLPSLAELEATSNPNNITLTWQLTARDDNGSNYLAGIRAIEVTVLHISRDILLATMTVAGDERGIVFTAEQLTAPHGEAYRFSVTLIYKSGVSSTRQIIARIDDDDDGDGIKDSEDSCPLSRTAGFVSDVNTNDIDGDGCEDQTEDVLPSLAELEATSNPNNITLTWQLTASDNNGSNYLAGIRTIEVTVLHISRDILLDTMIVAGDEESIVFTAEQLTAPHGEAYRFSVTLIYKSGVSSTRQIIARIDDDDDDDGIKDSEDSCLLSRTAGFVSDVNTNDIDGDGCEDQTEDVLPSLAELKAISNPNNITLIWQLTARDNNGSNYLAGIRAIEVTALHIGRDILLDTMIVAGDERSIVFTAEQLTAPHGEAYRFSVTLIYKSGVSSTRQITARIDDDDDDDGIKDSEDSCLLSRTAGFVSDINTNDIDGDGCEDQTEDVLPSLAELEAISNPNNITLTWQLTASDDNGSNYLAGIRAIEVTATHISRDILLATMTVAGDERGIVFTAEQLTAPHGEAYRFSVTLIYKSGVSSTRQIIARIDDDDDDDGIKDPEDSCPLSRTAGFVSDVNTNDIDGDGCEDQTEDVLPSLAELEATSNPNNITLTWQLTARDDNGSNYLAGIRVIEVTALHISRDILLDTMTVAGDERSIVFTEEQLTAPHGEAYRFSVTLVYKSDVNSTRQIIAHIDDDDDDDGIKDSEDSCPLSRTAGFVSDVNTNDIDGDGCEDQTEDVLPSLAELKAISNPNNITLTWQLTARDDNGSNYLAGIRAIEVTALHISRDILLDTMIVAGDARSIVFTAEQLTAPHGEAYRFSVTLIYKSGVSSTRQIIARIDDDDDDDGIKDSEDSCLLSRTAGFVSDVNTNDIDGDGCEDQTEDVLPSLAELEAISNPNNITLTWQLTARDDNGSNYLAGIRAIEVTALHIGRDILLDTMIVAGDARSIVFTAEQLTAPHGEAYRFSVTLIYKSGVSSTRQITARIDDDDDDDGIKDSEDSCLLSRTAGFVSDINTNDIDGDGCEDQTEDVLPSLAELEATSNPNNITLTWQLTARDDNGSNYLAGIRAIEVTALHISRDILLDTMTVAGDERSIVFTEEQLTAPHGEAYRFSVTLVYKSDVNSTRQITARIDDDDDDDGIKDPEDSCPLSRTAGFVSDVNTNDIDGDGCEDRTEDILPPVAEFRAASSTEDITLMWRLTNHDDNGTGYVAGLTEIEIQFIHIASGSSSDVITLASNERRYAFTPEQLNAPRGEDYQFVITLIYRSGVNRTATIIAQVDNDDDDDGIKNDRDNCRISQTDDFISNTATNDIDGDGCEDLTEDVLPSVAELEAVSNHDNVTLTWQLTASDDEGSNYIAGIERIEVQPIHVRSGFLLAAIELMGGATSVVVTDERLTAPQGEDYRFFVTLVYKSGVRKTAAITGRIDDDDDDDGVLDVVDRCRLSKNAHFISYPISDIDGDGCEDRGGTEDSLPAAQNVRAISNPENVTITWDLIDSDGNGTGYIAGIQSVDLFYRGNCRSYFVPWSGCMIGRIRDIDVSTTSVTLTQQNLTAPQGVLYQFRVFIYYRNGISVETSPIESFINGDDDGDGIGDVDDRCYLSLTVGFRSDPATNDIDGDGCEDQTEDVLPSVAELEAVSNHDNVTLTWQLTASDDEGSNYIAGIERIEVQPIHVGGGFLSAIELMGSATSVVVTDEHLTAPQGEDYRFFVTLVYKSGVRKVAAITGRIDDDDDDDGVLDVVDRCRLSKNADFVSYPTNDVDGDGCEDRGGTEDSLPAAQNVRAISNPENVTITWDLIDSDGHGTGYIAGIQSVNLSYRGNCRSYFLPGWSGCETGRISDIDVSTTSVTLTQQNLTAPQGVLYQFRVFIYYRSGLSIGTSPIVSFINGDDDGDGIGDVDDRCYLSLTAGFRSDPATNDIDGDGCEDQTEDDLPSLTELNAVSNHNNVTLTWQLTASDDEGSNYIAGIERIEVQPIHIGSGFFSAAIELMGSATSVVVTDELLTAPQGEDYRFFVTLVYKSGVRKTAAITGRIDDDDDDDGVLDVVDRCRLSKNADFVSYPISDVDGDGCEDRGGTEDSLPAAQNVRAISNPENVTITWDLIDSDENGTGYIAGIQSVDLFYRGNCRSYLVPWSGCMHGRIRDIDVSTTSVTLTQQNLTAPQGVLYQFGVFIYYRNGISVGTSPIVSFINGDDDGDGIGDVDDRCYLSLTAGFRSDPATNDIDSDGCEDQTEDDLPSLTELSAASNHNNVTLTWQLTASDDEGSNYIAGIERIEVQPIHIGSGFLSAAIELMGSATSVVVTDERLTAPQGEDYRFFVTLVYKSGVRKTAAITGRIDDDDDDDGVLDVVDRCRLSKNADFVSYPTNDIDGDGCEDREGTEGSLPAAQNVRAISNPENVTITWDLIDSDENGTGYIAGIQSVDLFYRGNCRSYLVPWSGCMHGRIRDIDVSTTSVTLTQQNLTAPQGVLYQFRVFIYYRNGLSVGTSPIESFINGDDDGDGIVDDEDNCPSIPNGGEQYLDMDGDNIGDACDNHNNTDRFHSAGHGIPNYTITTEEHNLLIVGDESGGGSAGALRPFDGSDSRQSKARGSYARIKPTLNLGDNVNLLESRAVGGAGGGGSDDIHGTGGSDIIFGDGSGGGAGAPYVHPALGSGATHSIKGGAAGGGDDRINGGAGADIIFGDGFQGGDSEGRTSLSDNNNECGRRGVCDGGDGGYGGGGGGGANLRNPYEEDGFWVAQGGQGGLKAGKGGGVLLGIDQQEDHYIIRRIGSICPLPHDPRNKNDSGLCFLFGSRGYNADTYSDSNEGAGGLGHAYDANLSSYEQEQLDCFFANSSARIDDCHAVGGGGGGLGSNGGQPNLGRNSINGGNLDAMGQRGSSRNVSVSIDEGFWNQVLEDINLDGSEDDYRVWGPNRQPLGDGYDTIDGGAGNDIIITGTGADTIILNLTTAMDDEHDRVLDFDLGESSCTNSDKLLIIRNDAQGSPTRIAGVNDANVEVLYDLVDDYAGPAIARIIVRDGHRREDNSYKFAVITLFDHHKDSDGVRDLDINGDSADEGLQDCHFVVQ